MKLIYVFAAALLLPGAATAQSEADMKRTAELERKCEEARAAKLAPMREELIEKCVKQDKRPRNECVAEFGDWGNTRGTAGGARGGEFYDLPECKAADEARKNYRR